MGICEGCVNRDTVGVCCDKFEIHGYKTSDGEITKTAYRAYVGIDHGKGKFDTKYKCKILEDEIKRLLIRDGLLSPKEYLHKEFLYKERTTDPFMFENIPDPRLTQGGGQRVAIESDNDYEKNRRQQPARIPSRRLISGLCHKGNPTIEEFLRVSTKKRNMYHKYWGKFNQPHKEQSELIKEDLAVKKTFEAVKNETTQRQFEALKRTYENDIKAVELSKEWGVSKSAVSKLIKKAKNKVMAQLGG